MGSQVDATCACGLEATINIGGGMATFMTTCYFPCLCSKCRDVVQVNLLAKRRRCPHCRAGNLIPYDDPELSQDRGDEIIAEWNMEDELGRNLVLTDAHYKCPRCGEFSLVFSPGACLWD